MKSAEEKAAEARRGPNRAGGRVAAGPMGMATPGEKSQNFGPSAKRLMRLLRPQRMLVAVVVLLAVASVALTAIGPKILGHATNIIFEGFFSKRCRPESPSNRSSTSCGLRGRPSRRTSLGMNLVPGQGIDFTALARVLLFVMALYLVGALLQWWSGWILAGVVTRTINELRADVEAKLNRLPLPYFDGQPRGELLSRVTNDVDNIQQSLSQTLSQLLTSLLTVVAVVALMFSISWSLALIALVTIPISMWITAMIAKRSQKLFVEQWKTTGELNGIVEETFTGHGLVKVFGRQRETQAKFEKKNDELYNAAFGAQFISGIIMPAMMFIGNLNYVVIAVVGGLRVASGTMSLGDVQAFIQYSRQFTQPLTQVASMANLLQSGVASAERVFEVLDAAEQEPDRPRRPRSERPRARRLRGRVVLLHARQAAHREPRPVRGAGPDRRHRGADRGGQDDAGQPHHAVLRAGLRPDHLGRRGHHRHVAPRPASRIGMVLQDTWLFQGTIRDNIAYSRPAPPRRRSSRRRGRPTSTGSSTRCPTGTTRCSTREAGNISAGEKQLLTIARAFLAAPELLILDEATSRSTPVPSCSSSTPWPRCAATGPASSSPTGCRRSATPTSSSSWRTVTSSSRVRTPSCSSATGPTRGCMPRSSAAPPTTSTRRPRRSPDPARAAA